MPDEKRRTRRGIFFIAPTYAAFIIYGSLFPFGIWTTPDIPLFSFIHSGVPSHVDKGDLVQNILVYLPFGFIMVLRLARYRRFSHALMLTVIAGGLLSFMMESLQQFIPSRISSLLDVLLNTSGAATGGMLAGLSRRRAVSFDRYPLSRDAWFRTDALSRTGLLIIAIWALAQSSPFVPSLDVAQLRRGLSLLMRSLNNPWAIDTPVALLHFFQVSALGLLACTLGRSGESRLMLPLAVVTAAVASKVVIVGRQLSLEMLAGAVAAVVVLIPLSRTRVQPIALSGMFFTMLGIAFYELLPRIDIVASAFYRMPFSAQVKTPRDLIALLEFVWPFMALAYFTRYAGWFRSRTATTWIGGLSVFLAVLYLEWHLHAIPERFGDITMALAGACGWILPWYVFRDDAMPPDWKDGKAGIANPKSADEKRQRTATDHS